MIKIITFFIYPDLVRNTKLYVGIGLWIIAIIWGLSTYSFQSTEKNSLNEEISTETKEANNQSDEEKSTEIFQNEIQISNADNILRYNINNAKLTDVRKDMDSGSLIFNLENSIDGQLILELSKTNQECLDGKPDWFALLNGEEEHYEIIDSDESIIFIINFPANTNTIELITSSMIRGMPGGCFIMD